MQLKLTHATHWPHVTNKQTMQLKFQEKHNCIQQGSILVPANLDSTMAMVVVRRKALPSQGRLVRNIFRVCRWLSLRLTVLLRGLLREGMASGKAHRCPLQVLLSSLINPDRRRPRSHRKDLAVRKSLIGQSKVVGARWYRTKQVVGAADQSRFQQWTFLYLARGGHWCAHSENCVSLKKSPMWGPVTLRELCAFNHPTLRLMLHTVKTTHCGQFMMQQCFWFTNKTYCQHLCWWVDQVWLKSNWTSFPAIYSSWYSLSQKCIIYAGILHLYCLK